MTMTPKPLDEYDIATSPLGVKYDADKLPMDLVPFDALEGCAGVLQHGAKKYADRQWEKGMRWGRLVAALVRHISAFMRGRDYDPDSGLLVVDHITCDAMMLATMFRRRKDLDDRPT